MSKISTRLSTLIVGAGLLMSPLALMAAPPMPPAPPPRIPADLPHINAAAPSQQEIHEFALVYLKVQKIRHDYSQKLSAEKDKTKIQKLRREGGQAIDSAVAHSDLGVKRYKEIVKVARKNDKVKQELIAAIKQVSKKQ